MKFWQKIINLMKAKYMNGSVKFFKLWFPAIVWMAVIFFFSSIPDLNSGLKYDFVLRKIAHIAEYFILTFFLYRAFKGTFDMKAACLFVWLAALSFFYAISDEIHQSFVPGRACAIGDVLIDSVGILGFCAVVKLSGGWSKTSCRLIK